MFEGVIPIPGLIIRTLFINYILDWLGIKLAELGNSYDSFRQQQCTENNPFERLYTYMAARYRC